jgi:hypothetical protein
MKSFFLRLLPSAMLLGMETDALLSWFVIPNIPLLGNGLVI